MMTKNKLSIFLLTGLFYACLLNVAAQEFSSTETISYINSILSKSESKSYKYEIHTLLGNELILYRYRLSPWEQNKVDHIKFELDDINPNIYISKDMEMCNGNVSKNLGGKHIQIWCKNRSDCIYDPQNNPKYTCDVSIYLDISEYDYQRTTNALKHLVSINQNNTIVSDNDPFAPKNNKENSSNVSQKSSNQNCDIKINNRPDGETIRYINPSFAGKNGNMELGISVQTNGVDYFLSTVVRSTDPNKKLINKLSVKLGNDESINLNIIRSEIAQVSSEKVRLGIYEITNYNQIKLMSHQIKVIILQESGGNFLIFNIFDTNVVQEQLKCLKN